MEDVLAVGNRDSGITKLVSCQRNLYKVKQRSLSQRFVSAFLGAAVLAAAAACGGGGTVVPPSSIGAQSVSTAPDAARDAALTTLKASEASQRSSQGWGGNNWDNDWANCPPSGSGSDSWPNGGNWWWDGQTWWHWTNHQWCRDSDHNSNCPGSGGGTASPKPTSTPVTGGSGGGTTVTTTTYDNITGLGLIVVGGVTGIFTTAKGGVATAYEPSVSETIALTGVNFTATCADPGPTTQSSSRAPMAFATATPAPTSAPTTAPAPSACVIVEYTNGANPVVVGSPLTNDILNGTLDFLTVSAVTLTGGDTYTFYIAYPVTTTVTTGGGGGSTSGGGSGSSCTTASQNSSNSYWDGSSWWSWFGGSWCHNQTPAPTCTPAPTPTPAPSNNNGGWGGWGWW
jgi:hypothetical protein